MLFKNNNTKRTSYTKYSKYKRGVNKTTIRKKSKINKIISSTSFNTGKKLFIYILLILITTYGIYYLFFSNSLIVTKTALFYNNTQVDNDIILSEINAFKGEALLSINKTDLINELKTKYPEIETIEIKKKLPNKLYVYIEKYKNTANLIVVVDNVQRKYILNSQGSIVAADTEDSSLPYLTMKRDKAFNSKEHVLEGQELDDILKATKLFEQKFNMQILDIEYLEQAKEYHLHTEKDFYVWLDLTQNYMSQLSKLKAAEQKLNIHTTDLWYIDLRIAGNQGEKIIFKKK